MRRFCNASILFEINADAPMGGFGLPSQDSPSLADVVVGVTTKAAMALLGDGGEASVFPKVQAYLQRLGQIEACVRGAADVGTFTKASPRNLRLKVSRVVHIQRWSLFFFPP